MEPFKLFFAGSWGNVKKDGSYYNYSVHNRLVSYAYPDQFKQWKEIGTRNDNIIIDSGAFSAWNSGKSIDITKYIQYCLEIERNNNNFFNIRYVNLDVIPGKAGETRLNYRDPRIQIESAQRGYINLKKFKREGITPIHVFHQGEDIIWLDRAVDQTDYIGISPANDMDEISKYNWILDTFEYIYKKGYKIKTHGFAVANEKSIINIPWYSCDAASWRLTAAMGNFFVYIRGKKYSFHYSDKIPTIILDYLSSIGIPVTELHKDTYRYIINIDYYLNFEKNINKLKKNIEFKPLWRLIE